MFKVSHGISPVYITDIQIKGNRCNIKDTVTICAQIQTRTVGSEGLNWTCLETARLIRVL